MTILFDSSRQVKSPRPFATGLSFSRRAGYTAADAAWWAANAPSNARDFDVVGPTDTALELAAGAALAEARMSAGFSIL